MTTQTLVQTERRSLGESIIRLAVNPLIHFALIFGTLVIILRQTLTIMREMSGTIMFAMDDGWIHMSIARNFVEGLGWGMTPGKFLSLSTSPTWTLLVGLAYLVYPDPVRATLCFSLLCMTLASIFVYLLAAKLTGKNLLGLLGALVFIFDPVSLWGLGSGMELPLSALGLSALLYFYYSADSDSKTRTRLVPVLMALAAVTRPELFALIPVMIADTWLSTRKIRGAGAAFKNALIQIGIIALCLAPYFALNIASHGMLFPTTYYAKTSVRGVGLGASLASGDAQRIMNSLIVDGRAQVFRAAQSAFAYNPLILLLLLPGLLYFSKAFSNSASRRGLLLPISIFFLPYMMGVGSPSAAMANHANRYFIVFAPLTAVIGMMGLNFFFERAKMTVLSVVMALGIILSPMRTTYAPLRHLGIDADSTQKLYVESAKWINENLPTNAVLAVNDIGTLAYFTKRDMIDVMGLGTVEIWPYLKRTSPGPVDAKKLRQYLKEKKVEYLMLSPKYYPDLTRDSKTFKPIAQWSETYEKEHGRTISPQIMYKVTWEN